MPQFRRHIWLFIALIPVALVYFAWSWNGEIGSIFNDGISYMVMAQHYVPGNADHVVNAAAFSRFPPLYPLILAWTGASADLYLAHALTTMFLLMGLIALYAWMRNAGFSSAQAALLMLSFAALPGSWLAGLLIQSEYLYLLWSLSALALLSSYYEQRRDELLLAAALAVTSAMLTRTVGVTLLPPLLIAALRAGWRTRLSTAAIALLPLLFWRALHPPRGDSYEDFLFYSYGHHAWDALQQQLSNMPHFLREGFSQNLLKTKEPNRFADVLGMLCLTAATWRAFKLRIDGVYVAGYVAVLLLWPYPGEAQRLLWVLMPVLLAQPILVIAELRHQSPDAPSARLATFACAAAMLAMAIPEISNAADRYRSAPDSGFSNVRGFQSWYASAPNESALHVEAELSLIEALHHIPDEVPENGCVISVRPDWINYYARRSASYPPRNSLPDPYFGTQLRASGCRYIFFSRGIDANFPIPMHPSQRLKGQFEILEYLNLPGMSEAQQPLCELAELR